jgi:hypothetical protein
MLSDCVSSSAYPEYGLDCGDRTGSEFHLDILSVSESDHEQSWSCGGQSPGLYSNEVWLYVGGKYGVRYLVTYLQEYMAGE